MKPEDQKFEFEKIEVSISYKEVNNAMLSPERLRIEYYNLLLERDNCRFDHISTLHSVLKALFTNKFNVRTSNSFKKELKKAGILLINIDILYCILKNDANSGIITKKMLED